MNKFRFTFNALAIAIFTFAFASMAQAQATRTWVSGVGDDANPCSRTAPCKTFAGAISKTAPSGEINVLDPGGFGAVTITKSITISSESFEAGVLVSGTNGIIINSAANTDIVTLKGLDIEGLGTGINGILIQGATGRVFVENCEIHGFAQRGISDIRSSASAASGSLLVRDTIIRNNGIGNNQSGAVVIPGANFTVFANFDNCRFYANGNAGLVADSNTRVTVNRSVSSNNLNAGFFAEGPGGAAELNIKNCVSSNNLQGITAGTGSTVRASESFIVDNTGAGGNGVQNAGGTSFGDGSNTVAGNAGNQSFNGTPITQQ
jgi:hypothetical protein